MHESNPTLHEVSVFLNLVITSESIFDFSIAQEPESSLTPTYKDLDIPIAPRKRLKNVPPSHNTLLTHS